MDTPVGVTGNTDEDTADGTGGASPLPGGSGPAQPVMARPRPTKAAQRRGGGNTDLLIMAG